MPRPYVRVGIRRDDGTILWTWKPNVARLDTTILNCAMFLYRDPDEARTGSRAGGTAFNLSAEFPQDDESMLVYVVTCRHCIEKGYTTVRANALEGGLAVAEISPEHWRFPEDGTDIAVAMLREFDRTPDITHLPAGLGVSRGHDLGIGDAIFMVGRLLMHDGREMNLPSLRFGNISMMPSEPIPASENLHADQEALVVEMRSIGGYSGSPVFVYDDAAGGDPLFSSRLLGVDYCHFNTYGGVHSGAAGVIPAWKIRELLYEDERIVTEREKEYDQTWTRVREGGPILELDAEERRGVQRRKQVVGRGPPPRSSGGADMTAAEAALT